MIIECRWNKSYCQWTPRLWTLNSWSLRCLSDSLFTSAPCGHCCLVQLMRNSLTTFFLIFFFLIPGTRRMFMRICQKGRRMYWRKSRRKRAARCEKNKKCLWKYIYVRTVCLSENNNLCSFKYKYFHCTVQQSIVVQNKIIFPPCIRLFF